MMFVENENETELQKGSLRVEKKKTHGEAAASVGGEKL